MTNEKDKRIEGMSKKVSVAKSQQRLKISKNLDFPPDFVGQK